MLKNSTAFLSRVARQMVLMNRRTKVALMLAGDLTALPVCYALSVLIRTWDPGELARQGILPFLIVSAITILAFALTGLYGAVIRFIDQSVLTAAGISLAFAISLTYLVFSQLPPQTFRAEVRHSDLATYWLIAFLFVVSSRVAARSLLRDIQVKKRRLRGPAVAIYGAGEAGVKLAQAMRTSDRYRVTCFFDDKPALNNRTVTGLKVYHSDRLVEAVHHHHVNLIVIAIPSATTEQRKAILYKTHRSGVAVKTLCNLMELADEHISTRSIRDIKIDDLLGRETIEPDVRLFRKCVRQKNVLVTGAGGSIGSELGRQIATLEPRELHLLDHCEFALYEIEQELKGRFPDIRVSAHLGSACDMSLVDRVVCSNGIDTIYHAAAYKHVPLVEANMAAGIRNNILSAQVVADAAEKFKVSTCVLISSDKAVRPTNMMGASKRIAELIFQAAALKTKCGARFCMVRFGNVLGSSGSVVPLFQNQIERGGPITVTHPEVVRYFMSIPEAAQLVIQAGAMATGGDVFVMDMGSPVKIVDLARTMIAMCGLSERGPANPQGDIEIRFVGLRPGEKLYEELFAGNDAIPSRHPRIMTTTEYVVEPDLLEQQVAYLLVACATNDAAMIKQVVKKLVPGYAATSPGGEENAGTADTKLWNDRKRHAPETAVAFMPIRH